MDSELVSPREPVPAACAAPRPTETLPSSNPANAPMRVQYAYLCAHAKPDEWDLRYERGLADYDDLVREPGIVRVGIDWKQLNLVVGTCCIEVPDTTGTVHELGEYIIELHLNPPSYCIENTSRMIEGHPHPHINDGRFCMPSGDQQLMLALQDGLPSQAIRVLLYALRMDPDYVEIGRPFSNAALDKWPLKGAAHE